MSVTSPKKKASKEAPAPKPAINFFEPVDLDLGLHYEDAEKNESLRELVPKLRSIQLQKEADRQRIERERVLARERKLQMEKAAGVQGSSMQTKQKELLVSDMGITFDSKGEVLKVKRPALGNLDKLSSMKSLVSSQLREDLTRVQKGDPVKGKRSVLNIK